MISGDAHMLAYEGGEYNVFGHFPIFQCSAIDASPSCKKKEKWSESGIHLNRNQYCQFEISPDPNDSDKRCLQFKGFSDATQLLEFNTCKPEIDRFERLNEIRSFLPDERKETLWWE